jgi:hypothetical protein
VRESDIEKAFVDQAELAGLECIKLTAPPLGIPDRLLIMRDGRCAFIEFKAPGQTPNSNQAYWLLRLTGLGHQATWFDGRDEALDWLDGVSNG